jgi:hypothetical protein
MRRKAGQRAVMPWSCAGFATAAAAAGVELDPALEVLDEAERVIAETGACGFLPNCSSCARKFTQGWATTTLGVKHSSAAYGSLARTKPTAGRSDSRTRWPARRNRSAANMSSRSRAVNASGLQPFLGCVRPESG